jgi:hypothetical protein
LLAMACLDGKIEFDIEIRSKESGVLLGSYIKGKPDIRQ